MLTFLLHTVGKCDILLKIELRDSEVLMKKTAFPHYAIDYASILYLSLIRKDHTNTFRFSMKLKDAVCPETLQLAVDRMYRRFPTIIAGFRPGFFRYLQTPASTPPQVQPDPGCLITMSREELRSCAYRVYYAGNTVSIEAFHALTDGYGAIASFTTLIAEYLRLQYGIHIPVTRTLVDLDAMPSAQEVDDAYLQYQSGKPLHLPSRFSYQLPGGCGERDAVRITSLQIPAVQMLDAAHRHGVSVTTLISSVMAASVMEIQQRYPASAQEKPVRIMVPVDLRRQFPSRTLRNFVLYALPTMEPQDRSKPLSEVFHSFARQIRKQTEKTQLSSIMSYNVRTQRAWYFRMFPLALKCAVMRIGYRFFGESNSSLTLTNLGNVTLPEEMTSYVRHIDVSLTPRVQSPYNCAILSYNGILSINISRFPRKSELEELFRRNLQMVMEN